MTLDFFINHCQSQSNKKRFGIIDLPPAKIDEQDGAAWIAVVDNEYLRQVTFTAVDHCIEIRRTDGKMEKRCDGFLTYDNHIIFLELKESHKKGSDWVKEADAQLKVTIGLFEYASDAAIYKNKMAYIANSERPRFRQSQKLRMEQFLADTGYVLRIENRIII